MAEHVTREVVVGTDSGAMRGTVAVRKGPMRLRGLVDTALALTEALARRADQLVVLQGKSISCQAGCGACCRQLVPIAPPEAFFLMDVLESLPAEQAAAVRDRYVEIGRVLEDAAMIDEMLDPPATLEPVLPIAQRYFELQQACPFLVNESCGIHPRRPVACRDYSVTSPAERCADPYGGAIDKVPMPLPLSVPLARVTAAVTGEKPQLLPLSLVPRWCAAHSDLATRTWDGPELFDRFVHELRLQYPVPDES